MNLRTAYVFSDLYGEPLLLGKLRLEPRTAGAFQYARGFLDSGRTFALDPVNLPLGTDEHWLDSVPFIHGAILDAGPDDWGRRSLLYRRHDPAGLNALVYGSGSGVGSLLFSASRDRLKPRPEVPTLDRLTELLDGSRAIEAGIEPPPHIARLLDAGSSMGGARPKAVVRHGDTLWLAKFPARGDVVDQPLHEAATLTLAKAAGIRVPAHRIERVAGRNVLLVARFDADWDAARNDWARRHYLSMASVFTVGRRLRPDADRTSQSYMALAGFLASHGAEPARDRAELFRRMVFNVLLGHVDDHPRNHGMLMEPDGRYRLSPCFDIAPSNGDADSVARQPDFQAIGIGVEGSRRNVANLFSAVGDFGLGRAEAKAVYDEVYGHVVHWRRVFTATGVGEREQKLVAHRVLDARLLAPGSGKSDGPP